MNTISTPTIATGRIPIALMLLALLVGGCNSMVAPEDGNVLMPLKVGNMWIGVATSYEGSSATTAIDTILIVEEKVIGGETWFVADNGSRFINRADGLHIMEEEHAACENFTGRYPSRSGDSVILFESLVLLPDSDEPVNAITVNRVVTTDTTITTDAGTFSAYHYRSEVATPANARLITPESRFYKPNLGPVRIEHGESDNVVWRWDLVKAVIL
jgi:hypothetical protein